MIIWKHRMKRKIIYLFAFLYVFFFAVSYFAEHKLNDELLLLYNYKYGEPKCSMHEALPEKERTLKGSHIMFINSH